MSLHPIHALDSVIAEYRDYLQSEFRARDSQLRDALTRELDRARFLSQEPFYQAHRPFRNGARWDELPLDPVLARAMRDRSRSEHAYSHQSIAINHLLGGSPGPLVVTTGTGSGKTESFLLPVIQNALRDAREFPQRSGLTAVIVYPMNALANDQEKRINELLEAAGAADSVKVKKYDRGTSQPEREQMRNTPPRILLTNYVMLEYLLVRPADRDSIFANHRCRFLVLDEVHTYRGILGSNIALLVRRLQAHLGQARQDWRSDVQGPQASLRYPRLLCVGTSATIKSVNDPALSESQRQQVRDTAVQEFFHRLTGCRAADVRVVGEELQEINIPAEASISENGADIGSPDIHDLDSVKSALCASAGASLDVSLEEAVRRCRLLWLLNRWLIRAPMPVSGIVQKLKAEVPEREAVPDATVQREVEAVLIAGASLPEDTLGILRLRAHRMIRGGWKFTRCIEPGCGRLYPKGEERCECGRDTAPLHLCRSCGADYLQLGGDPASGGMHPWRDGDTGLEWMLFDPERHAESPVSDDGDDDDDGSAPAPRPRRTMIAPARPIRGQQVQQGSFDPITCNFSSQPNDNPMTAWLVPGRSKCVCCGGTAGSRNVLTPVSLGTSAAVKVLGEGVVESLAEANADRSGHDGKERLLIFSDSRQDAAHQARFIIFASRYDRMKQRLYQLLLQPSNRGPQSLQRTVELLGDAGVRARDNRHAPANTQRLSPEERQRVRAWEEAPLLDEISVNPFYRSTVFKLGLAAVSYYELAERVADTGEQLATRLGISGRDLTHLARCFLDEMRVRGMLSREMLQYHPKHAACPDYIAAADWERKNTVPNGLPVVGTMVVPTGNPQSAPAGVAIRNAWLRAGRGGAPAWISAPDGTSSCKDGRHPPPRG